jgi:hypothetical protein
MVDITATSNCPYKRSDIQEGRDCARSILKSIFVVFLVLGSCRISFAGSMISVSGAVEPAFYSTGDYRGFLKSLSAEYWPCNHLGISASMGRFDFLQDHGTWFTSIQANVIGIEAMIRTESWHRQRLQFSLGVTRQHKIADETFLEIATKDSVVIQKFLSGYMNASPGDLQAKPTDFRMRTAIRDAEGYYRAGISQVRNYSLYGASAQFSYNVRLFNDVWAQISPKMRYYPNEPLYIWSLSFGLIIPLLP